MSDLQTLLNKYNYKFPNNLIAQSPAKPRDAARLLIYNRKAKQLSFDTFTNLANYLPKNSILVFNETKVIPARITATKPTGGKLELLYLSHKNDTVTALCNKPLSIGMEIDITKTKKLKALRKLGKEWTFKILFNPKELLPLINKLGSAPLPPYIKQTPLSKSEQKEQYQTIFAKTPGSVAAPTASLHFTSRLLSKLKKAGIDHAFITLHVGMGTFAPITEEHIKNKKLHQEFYEIDTATADKLNKAKKEGKKIIPVGTTSMRTLESAVRNGKLTKLRDNTSLFIQEGYEFQFASGLITNFHVPKSSLIMLVSSLAGRKTTLDLYKKAINKKFRLFSFGDGMLII